MNDRKRLMLLGRALGFPDLQCPPFAIAEGEAYWEIVAMFGRDEMIAAALLVLDSQQAA